MRHTTLTQDCREKQAGIMRAAKRTTKDLQVEAGELVNAKGRRKYAAEKARNYKAPKRVPGGSKKARRLQEIREMYARVGAKYAEGEI